MTTTRTSRAGSRAAARPGRQGGYTLLELLVVMAIAGLLAVTLAGTVFSGRETVTLRAAAEDLTALLKRTRGAALRTNREAAVFVDVAEKTFGVEGGPKRWPLPSDSDVTLLTAAEEILHEDRGAIRFFPDGSATGGGIRLSQNGSSYQVSVHWLTGQVSLAK
ncbi:GspH/FimT family pseudopilin [Pelagibius sp.]|uniref:GspH/FimT family pseudopilin n=1 Tax=Pelagibius sp. TaxID=1931238 RepID=UPI003B50689D